MLEAWEAGNCGSILEEELWVPGPLRFRRFDARLEKLWEHESENDRNHRGVRDALGLFGRHLSRGYAGHEAFGDDGSFLPFWDDSWRECYHQGVVVQICHACRDERYGEHGTGAGLLSLGGFYESQGSVPQTVLIELYVRYVDPHGDVSRKTRAAPAASSAPAPGSSACGPSPLTAAADPSADEPGPSPAPSDEHCGPDGWRRA